jgi:NADH:ubiquinone oxidoreductase subunit F (NADH-binding)
VTATQPVTRAQAAIATRAKTTIRPMTTTRPMTEIAPVLAIAPVPAISWSPRARLPRLLAGIGGERTAGLREHERHYGPLPVARPSGGRSRGRHPERLIDVVEAAGLTGRGGSGFPVGRKMRSVAAGGGRKAVVANGAEGEPASRKDRLLLNRLPHLVLDGITLAAQAVGADEAYLCVHGTEGALLDRLDHALEERQAAGLDPVPIQLAGLPARYVSSEQSSIVQYLNGGPAKPTFSPPRPHERGVNGKPTLVHNVETLAHLALIARRGGRWFRSAGLPSAPGSMLVTVSGAVTRPGVYEIEMGTPAGQVVMLAGGPAEPLQALLVGGYFGAWLPVEAAWTAPMTHAGLKAMGGALGAGMVIALPAAACPIAETARVVRYLAEESAGQCGPCLFGLPALADALASLAYSGDSRERDRGIDDIAALIPLIEGRGACRHPDGATQLVRSLLTAFPADAHWHQWQGACDGVRRPPLLPLPRDEEREWD